jgi:hypothetical protein
MAAEVKTGREKEGRQESAAGLLRVSWAPYKVRARRPTYPWPVDVELPRRECEQFEGVIYCTVAGGEGGETMAVT